MSKDAANPESHAALRFVLFIGVLSFFADFTYEGSRSIIGQFLASLQASATIVGIVTGFGELAGYGLRLVSGRLADATGKFWPIIIFGYVMQMGSVPALALASSWQAAAALIILERIGKAIRNPPRDVMLSYAAERMGGYGWAFGLHEAFDQSGALVGPLLVAAVLAKHGDYKHAFAVLLIPAIINVTLVLIARAIYPRPQELATTTPALAGKLPAIYWIYLIAAALVAAGFTDYPLIALHLTNTHKVSGEWIAIFYSIAMAVSGAGSLLFGRLFDRFGFSILILLTAVASLFAPLAFFGGFWAALIGAALWGLGIGVHESIIPAAIAPLVSVDRRASAFGLFTAVYGMAWFCGSALIGVLYDHWLPSVVVFCMGTQILALPVLWWVSRRLPRGVELSERS